MHVQEVILSDPYLECLQEAIPSQYYHLEVLNVGHLHVTPEGHSFFIGQPECISIKSHQLL
jgi:hypothetical protein